MPERDYEYEKQKTEFESQAYLRGLLRVTVQSIDALGDYESELSDQNSHDFKENVNKLSKFYYFKFNAADDTDRPSQMKDEDVGGPADLTNCEMKEVKKVFYSILELQEELGHTKLESLKRGNRVIS